ADSKLLFAPEAAPICCWVCGCVVDFRLVVITRLAQEVGAVASESSVDCGGRLLLLGSAAAGRLRTRTARWAAAFNALLAFCSPSAAITFAPGLAGRLRLGGHRPLQLSRQADILDLHSLHLDAPCVGGGVQSLLHQQGGFVPAGQQLVETGAVPRTLRSVVWASSFVERAAVLDVDNRHDRVEDPVVHHGLNRHGHRVFSQHLLGGHVECHGCARRSTSFMESMPGSRKIMPRARWPRSCGSGPDGRSPPARTGPPPSGTAAARTGRLPPPGQRLSTCRTASHSCIRLADFLNSPPPLPPPPLPPTASRSGTSENDRCSRLRDSRLLTATFIAILLRHPRCPWRWSRGPPAAAAAAASPLALSDLLDFDISSNDTMTLEQASQSQIAELVGAARTPHRGGGAETQQAGGHIVGCHAALIQIRQWFDSAPASPAKIEAMPQLAQRSFLQNPSTVAGRIGDASKRRRRPSSSLSRKSDTQTVSNAAALGHQSEGQHRVQGIREALLSLLQQDDQAGLVEQVQQGAPRPADAAVLLVKVVLGVVPGGDDIVLDADHAAGAERGGGSAQKVHQMSVAQMADDPLNPDQVVAGLGWECQVLRASGSPMYSLDLARKWARHLGHVNRGKHRQQELLGNPADAGAAIQSRLSCLSPASSAALVRNIRDEEISISSRLSLPPIMPASVASTVAQ
uniref:ANK_REP_REGION domain-containing protein n=1 Tax=Macrostomum lignano TaxID=282301 RepID=A0A1I8F4P9_9PLAT